MPASTVLVVWLNALTEAGGLSGEIARAVDALLAACPDVTVLAT